MEVRLRSELHNAGYRFRKNVAAVLGKPDIVFSRERVAIFVDGDYWHARALLDGGLDALRASLKTANREFWVAKLQRNAQRDATVTAALQAAGWKVVRIWESDVKRDSAAAARRVARIVRKRRALSRAAEGRRYGK
jgi:DNA mismatch endonuclease, patch repair protein